jgi:hypothetical protein
MEGQRKDNKKRYRGNDNTGKDKKHTRWLRGNKERRKGELKMA